MTQDNKLRGLVYEKYKTKSALAEKLGWSKQKLNWSLEHPEKLRLEQVQELMTALGANGDSKVADIFLQVVFKST